MTKPLVIHVTTGTGVGQTQLSAFDQALYNAGASNRNLVRLSSVIPPNSVVKVVDSATSPGDWGDRLYCVYAEWRTSTPGAEAWAGIGWVQCPDTGKGLFVEHEGPTKESVTDAITASLEDLQSTRGVFLGPIEMQVESTVCVDQPVCALVLATFESSTWTRA